MLKSLKFFAPVLIPSWRFFDTIAASPRIEFALLGAADETAADWQEFRPRPQNLSFGTVLRRLFWNPNWNDTLFLTSCAERLLENPTEHSVTEISTRIAASLNPAEGDEFFQFRLVLISRAGDDLQKEVAYISPRQLMTRPGA
ncbi:hypothetical protein HBA54_21140 [Pelagibius litoralis]|uniref:Uncharacterized protein n=1 Tax=Pelagibius litoralis TaxID=374515 RepID=A0A967F147_9PROT|nr:hypothetical protein [Pelagibius litoralis]NIA71108.1 hypothetical protein [Pelagibius litoralis]